MMINYRPPSYLNNTTYLNIDDRFFSVLFKIVSLITIKTCLCTLPGVLF